MSDTNPETEPEIEEAQPEESEVAKEAVEIAPEAEAPPPQPEPNPHKEDEAAFERLQEGRERVKAELGKVIIGQEEVIDQILLTLLCGGHCLLTGAPGLAKTLLVKSVAQIFQLKFNRIQFTPDLMPADITGTEILTDTPEGRKLSFVKGPIFANIILADEINRTPPKTQAALLESMQAHQVTAALVGQTVKQSNFQNLADVGGLLLKYQLMFMAQVCRGYSGGRQLRIELTKSLIGFTRKLAR